MNPASPRCSTLASPTSPPPTSLTTVEPNPDRSTAGHLELHEPGTDRRRPGRARRPLGCVHAGRHSLRALGAPAAVPRRSASGSRGRTGDPSKQEPSRLGSIDTLYRGDVEIIVAKALEKDKTRRYASAGDLASDIRRYLRGEAILARPASALYQLRKFARRTQGAGGRRVGHLRGAPRGDRRFDRSSPACRRTRCNERRAADEMPAANERERAATYQTYRARIAAAVAALVASRRRRCGPSARRGPGSFARLGMAAPAHPT